MPSYLGKGTVVPILGLNRLGQAKPGNATSTMIIAK